MDFCVSGCACLCTWRENVFVYGVGFLFFSCMHLCVCHCMCVCVLEYLHVCVCVCVYVYVCGVLACVCVHVWMYTLACFTAGLSFHRLIYWILSMTTSNSEYSLFNFVANTTTIVLVLERWAGAYPNVPRTEWHCIASILDLWNTAIVWLYLCTVIALNRWID